MHRWLLLMRYSQWWISGRSPRRKQFIRPPHDVALANLFLCIRGGDQLCSKGKRSRELRRDQLLVTIRLTSVIREPELQTTGGFMDNPRHQFWRPSVNLQNEIQVLRSSLHNINRHRAILLAPCYVELCVEQLLLFTWPKNVRRVQTLKWCLHACRILCMRWASFQSVLPVS